MSVACEKLKKNYNQNIGFYLEFGNANTNKKKFAKLKGGRGKQTGKLLQIGSLICKDSDILLDFWKVCTSSCLIVPLIMDNDYAYGIDM